MSKTKHARFGPSRLDSLAQCPRFEYRPFKDDGAANEGTEMHKAAETGIMDGLNDEQVAMVTISRNFLDGLTPQKEGNWEIQKEEKVTLVDLTYGSCDWNLVDWDARKIIALDHKYTRVEHDHSFQARTYGAAKFEMIKMGHPDMDFSDWVVETYIVAPRLKLIETDSYNAEELLRSVRADITALYEFIGNPFSPPRPNGELCSKCKWISECPAAGSTALTSAKSLGLHLPDNMDLARPVTVDDRALRQALAGLLESWAKEAKKDNSNFVKSSGQDIPGYKLLSRSTGMRIPKEDTPTAIEMLRNSGGYDEADIFASCRFSMNDLAKLKAATSTDSVAVCKGQLKDMLGIIAVEGSATYLQKTKRVSDEDLIKKLQGI